MNETKKFWFKAKDFGWGWYPASWQAWLVLLIYITAITFDTEMLAATPFPNEVDLANFWLNLMATTVFLIIICVKTGEKPQFRWGRWTKKPHNRVKNSK